MSIWAKTKPPQASRLAVLLTAYPALTPVHVGCNGAAPVPGLQVLTLAQCHENLAASKSAMPERLRLLDALLAELGLDSQQAYVDPVVFVAALHRTMLIELPPLYRPELASHAAREASDRAGPHIVLSLMADLALLEIDILMRAKPGCFLGLNLNPGDRTMLSWRRPCLLGLVDGLFPRVTNIYDIEADWFGYYANMDHPGRLAAPDRVTPATWGLVIGGTILSRLDRDIVDPALADKLERTWLGKAG